jgi:hypothetical protein
MSVRERAELCKRAEISIFAARRAEIPDSDYISEYLRS